MTLVHPVCGLLLGTASLLAQPILDATFVAASDVVVAFGSERRSVPVGTALTGGVDLATNFAAGGFARTRIRYRRDVDSVFAEVKDDGASAGLQWASSGDHATRLHVRARQPTRAKLVVSFAHSAYPPAMWRARVDVGDDGSYEYDSSMGRGVFEQIVQLDPAGLAIRTLTGGVASVFYTSPSSGYDGTVTIEVVPVDTPVVEVFAATSIQTISYLGSRTIPAGTGLRPRARLPAPGAPWQADVNVADAGIDVTVSETGTVSASTGPHDVVVVLRSPVPTLVRVNLTANAQCSGVALYSDWSGQIDIGDDGSFELRSVRNQSVGFETVVPLGATGLRIRTRSGGFADAGTTFAGRLTISIAPALRCRFETYGSNCGPELTGVVALQDVVDLRLRHGQPDSICNLLLGVSRTDLPLPFSACRLLVNPMVAIQFPTDAIGAGRHRLRVPPGFIPTLVAQDLVLLGRAPPGLSGTAGLAILGQ